MTFLQQAWQSQKNILIHCWAGKNRSVTTAAIFMVLEGLASSFEEAVQMIQSVRPVANPDAM
jgi:protein-tyrosine phosphatase